MDVTKRYRQVYSNCDTCRHHKLINVFVHTIPKEISFDKEVYIFIVPAGGFGCLKDGLWQIFP